MSVASISFNESSRKWTVVFGWISCSDGEFDRAQDAIDFCKAHGKMICWL